MVAKVRAQRIAEQIREDLSELLITVVTDPRLGGVTVTDVEVDRELAYAKVYVSAFEGSGRKDDILEALQRAQGFLRHHLIQRIELRSFPQLRFKWDATAERAAHMDRLFASLAQEPRAEEDLEEEGPPSDE